MDKINIFKDTLSLFDIFKSKINVIDQMHLDMPFFIHFTTQIWF